MRPFIKKSTSASTQALYFFYIIKIMPLPSTSTSFPTIGSGSRLCRNFFLGDLEICCRSRSFSFFRTPLGEWEVNENPSISSFSGDIMTFIFNPSASRNVSGSSLGIPPWYKDDLVEEECFLKKEFDDEAKGREWEWEWLPLLPPSRFWSFEECEEKEG